MGKRSSFRRMKNDAYDTPRDPTIPLRPHLPAAFSFIEPCAGKGDLASHLRSFGGICLEMFDIEPRATPVNEWDAMRLRSCEAQYIITNPPWTRELLHPLILHLCQLAPTWLLLDAAWAFTKQCRPYMRHCRKVVAVGRVRWIPGSPHAADEPTLFFTQPEAAE